VELTLLKLDTEVGLDVVRVMDATTGAPLVPGGLSGTAPDLPKVVAVGERSGCDGGDPEDETPTTSTCGGLLVEFRSDSSVQVRAPVG